MSITQPIDPLPEVAERKPEPFFTGGIEQTPDVASDSQGVVPETTEPCTKDSPLYSSLVQPPISIPKGKRKSRDKAATVDPGPSVEDLANRGDVQGVLSHLANKALSVPYLIGPQNVDVRDLDYLGKALHVLRAKNPAAVNEVALNKCLSFELWLLQRCENHLRMLFDQHDDRLNRTSSNTASSFPAGLDDVWWPRYERLNKAVKDTVALCARVGHVARMSGKDKPESAA